MKRLDQRGAAHLIIVVLVLVAVGGVGYFVWNKQKKDGRTSNAATNAVNKAAEEACKKEIDDKDFCKFVSNINFDRPYKSVITSSGEGGNSVMTMEVDDDKSRITTTTDGKEVMASVTIGSTSYIKDLTDGQWAKYTSDTPDTTDDLTEDVDFELTESDFAEDKTQYKKLDKEACGTLTCFKYQLIDPEAPSDENFVWFDDKDYQLRRWSFKNSEGATDMTYSYENVSISEPSPVKEAPDYENMTAEELQAEMEKAMQQYQNMQ